MKKDMRTIKPVGKGIHTDFTNYSCSKAQTLSSSKSFMQERFSQGLALPVLASAKALAFGHWPVFSFHSFDFKARTAKASRIHKLLMLQLGEQESSQGEGDS